MADKEPEDRQDGTPDPEASPATAESPPESEEQPEGSGGLSIVGALREALSGKTPLSAEESGAEPEGTNGGPPDEPEAAAEPAAAEKGGWFRRKFALRQSLRVQIAAGLGAAIVFTLIASIIALVAFFQVGRIQREINTEHVPALTNAVQIGQLATSLAAAAPRLVAEARNRQLATDPETEVAPDDSVPQLDLLESAARIIELSSELGAGEHRRGHGACA